MSVQLAPGREVSVQGAPGRFTVVTVNEDRGEVTCYGGPDGRGMWRTFRIERIRTVHRTVKRRGRA